MPASLDEPWMEPLQVLLEPDGILEQIRQALEELDSMLKGRSSKLGKAWVSVCWPFEEKEAKIITDRLHSLTDTATLSVSLSSHRQNRELLGDVGKIRTLAENAHFQTVLNCLSPLDFPAKREEILAAADRYAYAWILDTDEYKHWHDGNARSLWYYGTPGAGKSVLASSIYAELTKAHKTDNAAIAIAFCSFDNDNSQDARSIAASILKQLLQIRGDARLPPELQELHRRSVLGKDCNKLELSAIHKLIQSALTTFDAAIIILDGLGEAGKSADRAKIIRNVHSYGATTKVLICSRPLDDIQAALRKIALCESTAQDATPPNVSGPKQQSDSSQIHYQFRPREKDLREYVLRRAQTELEESVWAKLETSRSYLKEGIFDMVVAQSQEMYVELPAALYMARILCI